MVKYYKKVTIENDFTQPILTSNGTLGGNKFAVGINVTQHHINIWTCFNGQTDTGYITPDNGIYTPATVEITIYNPIPLNIKKFTLSQGSTNASGGLHAGTIYGSNDGANWVKVGTYSGLTAQGSTITEYINLPSNNAYYKYHKISNTEGGYNGVVLKEITITATQKVETWQECTKEEYDTLSSSNRHIENRYMSNVSKKYLKKVNTIVESSWTQPILKSNGTLGGDSFAVDGSLYEGSTTRYPAYGCFDNSSNEWWASTNPAYYILYNPKPINITNLLVVYSSNFGGLNFSIKSCIIQGSNDGNNWINIKSFNKLSQSQGGTQSFDLATNSNYYKYYRINNIVANYGSLNTRISSMQITATEQTQGYAWQECTKSEYDQLPDDQKYIENVNYIVKVA